MAKYGYIIWKQKYYQELRITIKIEDNVLGLYVEDGNFFFLT